MIDRGNGGYFMRCIRNVICSDICLSRIKTLSLQQGFQQERHGLTVTISLTDRFGRSGWLMGRNAGLVCQIAYVALHPGKGVGNFLLVTLCSLGYLCKDFRLVGNRTVDICHFLRPSEHILFVLERTYYEQMRNSIAPGWSSLLGNWHRQAVHDIGKHGVASLIDHSCLDHIGRKITLLEMILR